MKKELKIGLILFSLNVGNAARNCEQKLTPVKVIKIGRKYFTAVNEDRIENEYLHIQYYIENWKEKTDYCANTCLYISEKEWEQEKETNAIVKEIDEFFDWSGEYQSLTLEQLRKIKAIINS